MNLYFLKLRRLSENIIYAILEGNILSPSNHIPLIEQTELLVTGWDYKEPAREIAPDDSVENHLSIEVMQKRNSIKKGVAFRFRTLFIFENETILDYTGEDSYVIDFEDVVDKNEVSRMLRNTYSKFTEKFDFRKIGTALRNRSIRTLNESAVDVDAIIPLLT